MNWPTYAQYRALETQWLGQVPDHWTTRSPKTLFALHREPAHPEDRQLTASQSDGVVYQDEYMEARGARVVQVIEGQAGLKHVAAGDFVISLRSFQGGIEYSPVAGKISPAYTILAPGHEVVRGYFVHLLKSGGFVQELRSTSNQLRDGQSLGLEHFAQVRVPVPPHSEQVAIADFLDRETARIDVLIAKQEQLIATLREDRAATITQAVTKGLDPNVEMKDSGTTGLGLIPEGWETTRFKLLLAEPLAYGANAAADDDTPGNPRYVRITDIHQDGSLRPDTFRSLPPEVAAPYLLQEGDLLFARSGATVGKTFMYEMSWGTCCYAGYLIRARLDRAKIDPAYMNYFTATTSYWHHIMSEQIQATIQNVSAERYGELVVCVPPLSVQRAIVAELDDRCVKIDALIVKSTEMIGTLREYRSALITDAVTGKIDVRGVA